MAAQTKLKYIVYVEIKELEKKRSTMCLWIKNLISFSRHPPTGCLGKEGEWFEGMFSQVLVLSLITLNLFFNDGF